ncbi:MAG: hypothetical protein C4547_02635 [Phycisphaerales bacterium]|nr:MAG: hypothetical protein C4547_02635 [Phycisphaerales bacterium]
MNPNVCKIVGDRGVVALCRRLNALHTRGNVVSVAVSATPACVVILAASISARPAPVGTPFAAVPTASTPISAAPIVTAPIQSAPVRIAAGEASRAAVNPHWHPDHCGLCHDPTRPARAIGMSDVDGVCLGCHDGKRASRDAHPIGRPAATAHVATPAGWPTRDGWLSCLTCHDAVRACEPTAARPMTNPAFLRGWRPADDVAYCTTCHDASTQSRYSPHRASPPDAGDPSASCQYCHASVPAAAQPVRTGRAALRSDELSLCGACHTRHVDYFEPGHMGTRVKGPYLSSLTTFALPADPVSARPAASGADVLPLDPGGRIVCSTCHNPHQAGVFAGSSLLAIGAMADDGAGTGPALRLPAALLCRACHAR